MTTVQQLAAVNEPPRATVVCNYCQQPAELVNARVVYPRRSDLHENKLWYCRPCQAWVGCHKGTDQPLGILANATLRKLKVRVHALFDPLWLKRAEQRVFERRSDAYTWFAQVLEIPVSQCHVGMFDEERCLKAIFTLRAEWQLRGFVLPYVERK